MTKTVLTFTIAASAVLLLAQTVSAAPLCLPGYYDSGGVCKLCLPGYYCPNDDTLHICGLGFFCPAAGSAVPNPCPLGTTTIHTGSTYSTDCVPVCTSATEVCDGLDNDCDGQIDESLSRACYTGSPGTEGVGVCHGGTQTCTDGEWAPCSGEVIPQGEVCNLLDDDCNGAVDGGLFPCTPGACEARGLHVFWECMGGFCNIRDIEACTKILSAYYLEEYTGGTQYSGCDEAVQSLLDCSADHGCCALETEQKQKQCMNTNCHELYGNVYPTDADGDNYNELFDCDDNNDQVNPAAGEVCDGTDNDCDGVVDECPPGETCSGGTCTAAPAVPEFPTVAVPIGILGAFAIVVLVAGKNLI